MKNFMLIYDGFNRCYYDLLSLTMNDPMYVCRPGSSRPAGRGGGQEIRERLAQSFTIKNPRARLAFTPGRDLSVSYAVAELVWYLSRNDSTEWISYYAPFWRNISDDGITANSAYGARIFREWHSRIHGKEVTVNQSQWEFVRDELRRDPESRRAVLQIRSAADSWLANKDVPCTLSLQFFLRDGKLNLVVSMRSSDIILGLPYDVFAFTLFQELMALQLSVELGTYTHMSNSLHAYERDFVRINKIIADDLAMCSTEHPMPSMRTTPMIDAIISVEAKLRVATSAVDILRCMREYANVDRDPYWNDWIRVLASHRAGRLGLSVFQRGLLKSADWHGYGVFKR